MAARSKTLSAESTTTDSSTTEQPSDGTAVNEVPDAPAVVEEPTADPTEQPSEQPATFSPTEEEWNALTQRVRELEEGATSPEPSTPAATPFVEWDDHDEWGNPRTFYGVVLGEHPWEPGHVQVARLVPRVDGYDPALLRPLES